MHSPFAYELYCKWFQFDTRILDLVPNTSEQHSICKHLYIFIYPWYILYTIEQPKTVASFSIHLSLKSTLIYFIYIRIVYIEVHITLTVAFNTDKLFVFILGTSLEYGVPILNASFPHRSWNDSSNYLMILLRLVNWFGLALYTEICLFMEKWMVNYAEYIWIGDAWGVQIMLGRDSK